jgi:hypothetical protein
MDRDMSRTKRIPIARQPSLQVSPRAIELFEALERARKQRTIVTASLVTAPLAIAAPSARPVRTGTTCTTSCTTTLA